jgi:hypothetical protein
VHACRNCCIPLHVSYLQDADGLIHIAAECQVVDGGVLDHALLINDEQTTKSDSLLCRLTVQDVSKHSKDVSKHSKDVSKHSKDVSKHSKDVSKHSICRRAVQQTMP